MSPVNPGRLLASPFFPLFAGAAVLRGSHPGGTAAVAKASAGEAVAQLWQAPRGIGGAGELSSSLRICRRSARILPRAAGRYGFAAPAAVSSTPGPGIINLSLAWPVQQPLGEAARPIYHSLCAVLQRTSRASALPATPGGERFLLRWPV